MPTASDVAGPTAGDIRSLRDGILSYILATADFAREDRLWPSDPNVFLTNPLSVAWGAGGIAAFLYDALGEIPRRVEHWLLDRQVGVADYPPGLLIGMAGVAYSFCEVGLKERAEKIMAACYQSPILFTDPTMFLGVAGWGLCSLYFYNECGGQGYLDMAARAADWLRGTASEVSEGVCWKGGYYSDLHYGYGYGASGIAWFLLQAGLTLADDGLVSMAKRALAFDIARRAETGKGWGWRDREGGTRVLPYWVYGGAGVGTVAIRFLECLGDPAYLDLAEVIADGAFAKWTALPSMTNGVSGIGDFMLDMLLRCNRDRYAERALDIAATLPVYALDRPSGLAFPGRWQRRISNDFATGSAGIGFFLNRLLRPRRKFLVDLCATPRVDSASELPSQVACFRQVPDI